MIPKVFITYSHKDKNFVDEIETSITESTSVNICIDKKILKPGDSILKIFEAIETSDFLIPILSINSIDSEWCKKELEVAIVKDIEEKKFSVIPVIKEGEDWDKLCEQMPLKLRGALRDKIMARFDQNEYKEEFMKLMMILRNENISPEDISAEVEDPKSGNPFRRVRAEHFENQRIFAKLFTEPTQDYDVIISTKPAFIEGSRGSGKTMILNSLQARYAVQKSNAKSLLEAKLPYFGVYCKISRESFSSLTNESKSIDQGILENLFYNELIFKLVQCLIDEIKECAKQQFIRLKASTKKNLSEEVAQSLRLDDQKATDLETLEFLIEEQLDIITDFIDWESRQDNPKYQMKSLKRRHLENVCKVLKKHIIPINNLSIFFLIDEYENLKDFQKKILNTLIKWHSFQTWTFKVALKKRGFSTPQTLEAQELELGPDYSKVDLDFDTFNPAKTSYHNYSNYIKSICNKILETEKFKEKDIKNLLERRELKHDNLTKQELVDEVKEMLSKRKRGVKWEDLDKNKQNEKLNHYEVAAYYRLLKNKRRKFGGFDDFILLSSGIVRTFLELCARAYYFSNKSGNNPKKEDKIIVKYQTESTYSLSDYYLGRLRGNIEELGPTIHNFVLVIGDIFKGKLLEHLSEPEAARLSVSDPFKMEEIKVSVPYKNKENEWSVKKILDVAIMHSVLHESSSRGGRRPRRFAAEQPNDYILNRIFAPTLGFSLRPRWQTEFTSKEIQGLLDYETHKDVRKILMEKFSKEAERTLF